MITIEDTPKELLIYQDDILIAKDETKRLHIVQSNAVQINTTVRTIVSQATFWSEFHPQDIVAAYAKKQFP
jgi:hypothetical protein